jgi:nucleoside-diphosphate-sugar epimerase
MTTLFITGGTGFIGKVLVQQALATGYQVQVLTRSEKAAGQLRTQGAQPVIGDLYHPGSWQQVAAKSQTVIHLAQPEVFGKRLSAKRLRPYREQRLEMDRQLLDCLRPGTLQRMVYVGGSSYYGDLGLDLHNEEVQPNPSGLGALIAPAIEALPGYVARGLPIVEAYPAGVYGPGSWFEEYVLAPLASGKPIFYVSGHSHKVTYIHVEDCARALLYLLEYGKVGQRYFVVDNQPVSSVEVSAQAAQALGVKLRTFSLPAALCRALFGSIGTELLTLNQCLSNARLRELGFECKYPTTAEGVPEVVAQWKGAGYAKV